MTATPIAGSARDGQLRPRQPPEQDAGAQLSDRRTDMFVGATSHNNTPFSFTLDRFKLIGDYGGGLPNNTRLTGGAEYDMRERTYQEVVTTREMTLWGKVAAQPTEKLSTWLKYAYSWRDNSVYGTSYWFGYPENPLLRKFYLADRQRNMIEGRLDYAINEKITVGVSADYADDDYRIPRSASPRRAAPTLPSSSRPSSPSAPRAARTSRRSRSVRSRAAARRSPRPTGPARIKDTVRRARSRRQAHRDPEQARHRRGPDVLALAQRRRCRQHPRGAAVPDRQDQA